MSHYQVIVCPREKLDPYLPLIFSKWMRSLRYGNDFFKLTDSRAYYAAYQQYIRLVLSKANAEVRLAVLEDDDDVVLGFSVSRGTVLDYVFVSKPKLDKGVYIDYRRRGIGTALLPEGIDTITHLTRTGLTIWGSKYGSWKFNPFA